MAYGNASNSNSFLPNQNAARPLVTSYDSGYEHSFDHYVDVKLLLQEADEEKSDIPATLAAAS